MYIVAGNEFGIREGRTLIIVKALYGLRSSGLQWWERFSAILAGLGFVPSKAEDDIWMRDKGDHYEYIARYVDNLTIVSSKWMYGYLSKMKAGAIHFCVGEPNYSGIHIQEYDWEMTVYGEVEQYDCPITRGHLVFITTYVDANLCHYMLTGRATTGVLHLANQTILDYYTRKQPTVE